MSADLTVDVQVASSSPGVPGAAELESWIDAVLGELDYNDSVEVSLRIVDEDESRNLNREYRAQDKPTNVLSFASDFGDYAPDDLPRALGDIVLCAPVVEREAAEQGKALADHWGHMLVHGTLHLLGYDHMSEAEAAEMEDLERRVLAGLGVADPYDGN